MKFIFSAHFYSGIDNLRSYQDEVERLEDRIEDLRYKLKAARDENAALKRQQKRTVKVRAHIRIVNGKEVHVRSYVRKA